MRKIDMYQEVPEQFHNRLCDTLEQLEEEKVVKFPVKKYVAACAIALLATSTITVGAMELFQWYRAASERFETSKELENKLAIQGVAIPAQDTDEDYDIKMTALQAIKVDKNFYLLAAMEWPKELEWNGDILFGESEVVSEQEFRGCTANFAEEPDENGMIYVEIDVLGEPNVDYIGEVTVVLTNLIQTEKTADVGTLVEAQWELTFSLPTDAETRSFLPTQPLPVNGHDLELTKIELSPFSAKLYLNEEVARHATYFSDAELAAVQYEDGSKVETYGAFLRNCGSLTEEGEFYFNLPLNSAVDVDKVSGLIFKEETEEFTYWLGENAMQDMAVQQAGEEKDISKAEAVSLSDLMAKQERASDNETISNLRILYARHENVILTDNQYIYLWDGTCNLAEIIMDLSEYDYHQENGGEIAMMPGGIVMAIHPAKDSDKVYLLDFDYYDVQEADAETFWPVPRYEDYQASFFEVADRTDLPEGTYAKKGYEAQGSEYVLYSEDGSLENMKLLDIKKEQ